MKHRISIIVPTYNSEDTIAACIESIRQQTFVQWELLLVNDGSTDKSGSICDAYADKDARIRVIHQANKGRTEARAEGLRRASGEWVAFVDSDDTLPSSALADLLEGADEGVDIVFGNGYTLTGEHRKQIPMTDFRHLAVRGEGTIGVPWGSLFRRTVIPADAFDLPREITNGEDYIFWLKVVFSTEAPVHIIYNKVYEKGAEHTCNTYVWTAEYCYRLNEYRKAAIPPEVRDIYLPDMVADRQVNLFSAAKDTPRSEWGKSRFYRELKEDMRALGIRFSLKQRIFLMLPAGWMRRGYSRLSNWKHKMMNNERDI